MNVENLDVWTLRGQNLDAEAVLDTIIDKANTGHYSLIILDPIYKLMVGRSENMAAGVGAMVQKIDQLVENTGAAVVYAHHFTKGNAAKKKPMDRMSGSGVFARDADTIMTLTEHREEGCFTVELTLRNLPPQPAFVVEWDFPLMVERPDLDPKDLKREEAEEDSDLQPLLELLDEKPLTAGEWEEVAKAEGYTRATFYRKMKKLVDGHLVQFERKTKAYSRTGAGAKAQAENDAETSDTNETLETSGPGVELTPGPDVPANQPS